MKRCTRALLALGLALALCFSALPAPASAAPTYVEGSLDNFVTVRTYDDRFTDLQPWFRDNAVYLYELGLTDGKGGGKYGSAEEITVAEVAAFAARVRYIYQFGSFDGLRVWDEYYGDWYTASVKYIQELGLLTDTEEPPDGRYDRVKISRGEAAHIWANLLPDSAYEEINGDIVEAGVRSGLFVTDVTADTRYAQDILRLYRTGVVTGSGAAALYYPEDTILRQEFTAMVTRLVDPDLRVALNDWDLTLYAPDQPEPEPAPEPSAPAQPTPDPVQPEDAPEGEADAPAWVPRTMPELIRGTTTLISEHALNDEDAIRGNLAYMLQNDQLSLTLRFSRRLNELEADRIMQAYLDAMSKYYFEQSCGLTVQSAYTLRRDSTELTLYFGVYSSGRSMQTEQNRQLREKTMACALAVHDALWADGTITGEMTQTQIAWAYYGWIANNCRYDNAGSQRGDLDCHTALKLFEKGLAVCDGYTMAYNLLLEIEGINCDTAHTDEHIWTVADLDGTSWHIDTTWGDDETRGVDYKWFCMTEWEAYHRDGLR